MNALEIVAYAVVVAIVAAVIAWDRRAARRRQTTEARLQRARELADQPVPRDSQNPAIFGPAHSLPDGKVVQI